MTMLIRDANAADAAQVLRIYNHAALNTTAIWNSEASDLAGRERWLRARRDAGFPVLVADMEGSVFGFASYGEFRPFDGYRLTVEHSIYVDPRRHRLGAGRLLLAELIGAARTAGKHAMIGGIEAGNTASIELHLHFGFREVARMPEVGTKFGRWLDLLFLQLTLDDRVAP